MYFFPFSSRTTTSVISPFLLVLFDISKSEERSTLFIFNPTTTLRFSVFNKKIENTKLISEGTISNHHLSNGRCYRLKDMFKGRIEKSNVLYSVQEVLFSSFGYWNPYAIIHENISFFVIFAYFIQVDKV